MRNCLYMKYFLIIALVFTTDVILGQDSLVQSKAQNSILNWANSALESYNNPRFEKMELEYSSEEQSNILMREEYIAYKNELILRYESGELSKTQEQFDKDTTEIQLEIEMLDSTIADSKHNFKSITYYMWANVLTTKGSTVYYQFEFKLDENYEVIAFKESGSVGKQEDAEVVYQDR